MSVFKCKMCGASIKIRGDETVCTCEYCDATQTVPVLDNAKKINLFNRANKHRYNCDFDKAESLYESIVAEYPEEPEAYWGLCLCKYGIEYVDDPLTARKIPTCHRTAFHRIFEDSDFKKACEYADVIALGVYQDEAKEIDRLQQEILEIVSKEEPYDIFICYKETDFAGKRTEDSIIAQDIYNELTQRGYKVFFARVTLDNVLGKKYEPYIFAALNSAKMMLAVATNPEYYETVWMKNEWGRYLALCRNDKLKVLLPLYKNFQPDEFPAAFKGYQALQIGTAAFYQDLLRVAEKVTGKSVSSSTASAANNLGMLFKRVEIFLEEGDWGKADEYCEKILDLDAENSRAYFYKMMTELRIRNESQLEENKALLRQNKNFLNAVRFADDIWAAKLEKAAKQTEYNLAEAILKVAERSEKYDDYERAKKAYETVKGYKDADKKIEICENGIKEAIYRRASKLEQKKQYQEAIEQYREIQGYKDAAKRIEECSNGMKNVIYRWANELAEKKMYQDAIEQYEKIRGYEDVNQKIEKCKEGIYRQANTYFGKKEFETALTLYKIIVDYKDTSQKIEEINNKIKDIRKGEEDLKKYTWKLKSLKNKYEELSPQTHVQFKLLEDYKRELTETDNEIFLYNYNAIAFGMWVLLVPMLFCFTGSSGRDLWGYAMMLLLCPLALCILQWDTSISLGEAIKKNFCLVWDEATGEISKIGSSVLWALSFLLGGVIYNGLEYAMVRIEKNSGILYTIGRSSEWQLAIYYMVWSIILLFMVIIPACKIKARKAQNNLQKQELEKKIKNTLIEIEKQAEQELKELNQQFQQYSEKFDDSEMREVIASIKHKW